MPNQSHSLQSFALKKACLVAVFISVIIFSCVILKLIEMPLAIEIGATAMGILASITCLRLMYQEHESWHQKETESKKALLTHICHRYASLPPKKVLNKYLEQTLENHSSPQIRLDTIAYYRKNTQALDALMEQMHQQQMETNVLENLGLRWSKKNTRHPTYKDVC